MSVYARRETSDAGHIKCAFVVGRVFANGTLQRV